MLEEKVRQSRRDRLSLLNTPGLVERRYASSISKVPAEDLLRFDLSNGDYLKKVIYFCCSSVAGKDIWFSLS